MTRNKRILFIAAGVWVVLVALTAYLTLVVFPGVRPSNSPSAIRAANAPAPEPPPKDTTVTGVGVLVTRNEAGKFEITRVFPNSPAEKAGLAKGMLLTKVGNVETATKMRGELFKLLVGPVGSKVVLEVSDKNGDNARSVEIIRQQFLNRSGRTNADLPASTTN